MNTIRCSTPAEWWAALNNAPKPAPKAVRLGVCNVPRHGEYVEWPGTRVEYVGPDPTTAPEIDVSCAMPDQFGRGTRYDIYDMGSF